MLALKNVTFTYKKATLPTIKDVSFSVKEKSFVSLIGASGSGKTTIFRLLNGLEKPDSGEILINGKEAGKSEHFAGYMPQQDLLFPWRNVKENVMLPMEIQRLSEEKKSAAADLMLEKVGLSEWSDKYPRELSGGMRQRVSFARTICTGADLLLLDEPFSALDSITRMNMQEWLREQWMTLGKTILFITHDVEEAIFLSEEILVLTGKPVDIVKSFSVPLPKDRDRGMLAEQNIEALKEQLVEMLRSEASQ